MKRWSELVRKESWDEEYEMCKMLIMLHKGSCTRVRENAFEVGKFSALDPFLQFNYLDLTDKTNVLFAKYALRYSIFKTNFKSTKTLKFVD